MSGTTLPDRWPMALTDQHGATAYGWFPPGTPADPPHVLPAALYAEVCRIAGADPRSPWVAFPTRSDALAAAAAGDFAAWSRPVASGGGVG